MDFAAKDKTAAGKQAFIDGIDVMDNPYNSNIAREGSTWQSGWYYERNKQAKRDSEVIYNWMNNESLIFHLFESDYLQSLASMITSIRYERDSPIEIRINNISFTIPPIKTLYK